LIGSADFMFSSLALRGVEGGVLGSLGERRCIRPSINVLSADSGQPEMLPPWATTLP
jgi:hypothetical protein